MVQHINSIEIDPEMIETQEDKLRQSLLIFAAAFRYIAGNIGKTAFGLAIRAGLRRFLGFNGIPTMGTAPFGQVLFHIISFIHLFLKIYIYIYKFLLNSSHNRIKIIISKNNACRILSNLSPRYPL